MFLDGAHAGSVRFFTQEAPSFDAVIGDALNRSYWCPVPLAETLEPSIEVVTCKWNHRVLEALLALTLRLRGRQLGTHALVPPAGKIVTGQPSHSPQQGEGETRAASVPAQRGDLGKTAVEHGKTTSTVLHQRELLLGIRSRRRLHPAITRGLLNRPVVDIEVSVRHDRVCSNRRRKPGAQAVIFGTIVEAEV